MAESLGTEDPLAAIYDRLIPLVISNIDWWRDAVRRWANNPPLHGPKKLPLPIPLPEMVSFDEKVALLAAIHDSYATPVARIDPWPEPLNIGRRTVKKDRKAPSLCPAPMRYAILTDDRVPSLRKRWTSHKSAIAMFFANVVKEIKRTKRKRRGRKKTDYDTQQREAKLAASWKQAHETGTYKPDFAKENGFTLKAFERLLDRVRKHKARADK